MILLKVHQVFQEFRLLKSLGEEAIMKLQKSLEFGAKQRIKGSREHRSLKCDVHGEALSDLWSDGQYTCESCYSQYMQPTTAVVYVPVPVDCGYGEPYLNYDY